MMFGMNGGFPQMGGFRGGGMFGGGMFGMPRGYPRQMMPPGGMQTMGQPMGQDYGSKIAGAPQMSKPYEVQNAQPSNWMGQDQAIGDPYMGDGKPYTGDLQNYTPSGPDSMDGTMSNARAADPYGATDPLSLARMNAPVPGTTGGASMRDASTWTPPPQQSKPYYQGSQSPMGQPYNDARIPQQPQQQQQPWNGIPPWASQNQPQMFGQQQQQPYGQQQDPYLSMQQGRPARPPLMNYQPQGMPQGMGGMFGANPYGQGGQQSNLPAFTGQGANISQNYGGGKNPHGYPEYTDQYGIRRIQPTPMVYGQQGQLGEYSRPMGDGATGWDAQRGMGTINGHPYSSLPETGSAQNDFNTFLRNNGAWLQGSTAGRFTPPPGGVLPLRRGGPSQFGPYNTGMFGR